MNLLYCHEQLYIHICICVQNHNNDTIKTSGHRSLEKYTSHFIERVVCERELEIEQNCNILSPTLMAITAFLSRSPVLLNRWPGGPAFLGHGPHSSIVSPTAQSGVLRAPLCWVLVLSTASSLQLTRTSCAPSYIIVLRPLNSTCRQSRLFPRYLRPDAPVIYTGAFPILTARPGSICNKLI